MKKVKYYSVFLIYFIMLNSLFSIEAPKKVFIENIKISEEKKIVIEGSFVHVHYRGWLYDSNKEVSNHCEAKGKLFDSTLDNGFREEPGTKHTEFIFQKGKNNVIKGWEIGVEGMSVGSKRCLVIPPNFAYGNRKIGEIIPANSTLIFEIELISIRDNN